MMIRLATAFLALSALAFTSVAAPIEQRSADSQATWFDTGLGACGWTNVASDWIIALPAHLYDNGAHCGKSVEITNTATGKKVQAKVADECMGCQGRSIDLTKGLFSQFAKLDDGIFPVDWRYI
ncbi:riboflavin-aldehyde forming enzyme [Cytidiella melzeri]|nr:riboflavin-aldehyde forming enzyme [Cytidiella melzeri]